MLEQLLHTEVGLYSIIALAATVMVGVVVSALILKAMKDEQRHSKGTPSP